MRKGKVKRIKEDEALKKGEGRGRKELPPKKRNRLLRPLLSKVKPRREKEREEEEGEREGRGEGIRWVV